MRFRDSKTCVKADYRLDFISNPIQAFLKRPVKRGSYTSWGYIVLVYWSNDG